MIMDKYLDTDNAKLLESILKKQLTVNGLSIVEATKIARDDKAPREDIFITINWCKDVVKDYIEITGALCKGELKFMGAVVLDVPEWKFNQYILERHIKKADNLDLKEMLLKDGIKYEKLFTLIQELGTPRILTYKKVIQHNNIVWFTYMDNALKYVNNFLTEPYNIEQLPKKEIKKQIHKKSLYIPAGFLDAKVNEKSGKIVDTIDYSDEIFTPAEFAIKYFLDDKFYKGGQSAMPDLRENVDRTLFLGGLTDQEYRRTLIRKIISNYKFKSILKMPGSNDYSREKIKRLGEVAAEHSNREGLLADIINAFER